MVAGEQRLACQTAKLAELVVLCGTWMGDEETRWLRAMLGLQGHHYRLQQAVCQI